MYTLSHKTQYLVWGEWLYCIQGSELWRPLKSISQILFSSPATEEDYDTEKQISDFWSPKIKVRFLKKSQNSGIKAKILKKLKIKKSEFY